MNITMSYLLYLCTVASTYSYQNAQCLPPILVLHIFYFQYFYISPYLFLHWSKHLSFVIHHQWLFLFFLIYFLFWGALFISQVNEIMWYLPIFFGLFHFTQLYPVSNKLKWMSTFYIFLQLHSINCVYMWYNFIVQSSLSRHVVFFLYPG